MAAASTAPGGGGGGPGGGPTRGALLRSVFSLTNDILSSHARFEVASSRLAEASASKAGLLREIADAEAGLARLDAQKKHESENDGELVALQQANAALAVKRQELVRATRGARAERDRLRDEAAGRYYARLGAAVEAERAAAACAPAAAVAAAAAAAGGGLDDDDDASPPLPVVGIRADSGGWDARALGLLGDCEALWKRVSTQASSTRDLLQAGLARRRLALQPVAGGGADGGGGGGGGSDSPATAASATGGEGAAGAPASGDGADAGVTGGGVASTSVVAPQVYPLMSLGRGRGQEPLPPPPSLAGDAPAPAVAGGAPSDADATAAVDWEGATLAADAAKATDALAAVVGELRSLQAAVTAAALEGDAPQPPACLAAVSSLLALIDQSAALQLSLLAAVTASVRQADQVDGGDGNADDADAAAGGATGRVDAASDEGDRPNGARRRQSSDGLGLE